MISTEIKRLYHIGSLLYATTNVYCLAIDIEKHTLVEIPQCHLDHCFCQQIAKRSGINISYDHIYHKCDISTNINKQVIYECPFGLSNIIVPVFKGTKCVSALHAGPILTMDPREYLEKKILPIWNLKEKEIVPLLEDLKHYPQGDTNYVIALSELMSSLVDSKYIQNLTLHHEPGEDLPLEDSNHQIKSNLITSVVDFITSNYAENITLSDAAKYAYVNPSHLSREFNKSMNCNFRSYLNNIRIEKAKELLANTDLSLADIGNQVGFTDQSYFNKIFRKHEDLTPGQYRTLKRKKTENDKNNESEED